MTLLAAVASERLLGIVGVELNLQAAKEVIAIEDGFLGDLPCEAEGSRLGREDERAAATIVAQVGIAILDVPLTIVGRLEGELVGQTVGIVEGVAVDGERDCLSVVFGNAAIDARFLLGLFIDEQIGVVGRNLAALGDAHVVAAARRLDGTPVAIVVLESEGNGAVAVLADVVDKLVEQLGSVNILVVERGSRRGLVAKAVVGSVGIGVGGHAAEGVVLGTAISLVLIGAIGGNPGHALVAGGIVRRIVGP